MSYKVVVVNAAKMNFDGKLDFSSLSDDVQVFADSSPEELLQRIQGADVVVTKELPVPAELLAQFPASVRLLVEAGTGYNNIDLPAAKAKGITVCNIPAYSSQRVAHTAIMLMLNLASSMQVQLAMLARGDHQNFTQHLLVPHIELNGKTLGVLGAGHIGRQVIRIAQAMEMNVLVATRTPRPDEEGIRYVSVRRCCGKVISSRCIARSMKRRIMSLMQRHCRS
jgi:glycerate dehydrogenase